MIEIWHAIFSVTSQTIYLVAGLTAVCAYLFLLMTDSRPLTLMFTPVAAFGSLVGIYLSREFGLYYSADKDSNIVLSSLLGLCVSLTVVVLTAKLGHLAVRALRNRQANKLRNRRN